MLIFTDDYICTDNRKVKEDGLTIMNLRSTKETLFYSGSIRLDLGVVLRGLRISGVSFFIRDQKRCKKLMEGINPPIQL